MRYHLLIIFLMLACSTFAGRSYSIEVHVADLVSGEPIANLQVLIIGEKETLSAKTDDAGTVVFENLKKKSVRIEFEDMSGKYNVRKHVYLENKERIDLVKKVNLRWNAELELDFFNEREERAEQLRIEAEQEEENEFCFDEETAFPGGAAKMQQFISENLIYPEESIEFDEQGRVYLKFVIEKNGEISSLTVERGVSKALDHEAKMLIYYMPKWIPGKCNGEPIRTWIRLPITFSL